MCTIALTSVDGVWLCSCGLVLSARDGLGRGSIPVPPEVRGRGSDPYGCRRAARGWFTGGTNRPPAAAAGAVSRPRGQRADDRCEVPRVRQVPGGVQPPPRLSNSVCFAPYPSA